MRKLLAVLLLCPVLALAAPRAVFPGGHITLTKEKCRLEQVLSAVPPEFREKLLKADVVYKGKKIEACWVMYNGQVQGADEYMNTFVFDVSDFAESTEA